MGILEIAVTVFAWWMQMILTGFNHLLDYRYW